MKQHQLSATKRLTKPILLGTIAVGLATAFYHRHRFLEDIQDLRAQEQAHNDARLVEILERRQKLIEEVAKKRKERSNVSEQP